MARRRARVVLGGVLVTLGILAAACSKPVATDQVSARSGSYGASLETSTTTPNPNKSSSGSSSATRTGSRTRTPTKAEVASELLSKLQANPELAKQLATMTPDQLSQLTGLTSEELATLGLTPSSVATLGQALVASQGGTGTGTTGSGASGDVAPALLAVLTGASGQITGDTRDVLRKMDPGTLAAILGTAAQVDPALTSQLGRLLAVVDPNGLGQLSNDQSSLAVLAVIASAALGRDVPLTNLLNGKDIDPQFKGVLFGIANLAGNLTPKVVSQINNITGILGPNVIRAMGIGLGLLQRPEIGELVRKAAADPITIATAFGSALLLIPGLAEAVAPKTFTTPDSRIAALAAIFAVSLVRMDVPGVRDFLTILGVKIPPELLPAA